MCGRNEDPRYREQSASSKYFGTSLLEKSGFRASPERVVHATSTVSVLTSFPSFVAHSIVTDYMNVC